MGQSGADAGGSTRREPPPGADLDGAIEETDRWPEEFDRYERLLECGRDAGRSVRFADPLEPSLVVTVADLARARPGIEVSDLAGLLNLEGDLAAELARRAVAQAGVTISFDTEPPR